MKKILPLAVVLLFTASLAYGQHSATDTTTLSVLVSAEAAISVDTADATTSLTSTGIFNDYFGTTHLHYYIRTLKGTGTGHLTLKATSDFAGAGGPSIVSPPTGSDTLTYTNTVSNPGTAASGQTVAALNTATDVASWGADAHSAKAGNTASVLWDLSNDPLYQTGTYTAGVQFTIAVP